MTSDQLALFAEAESNGTGPTQGPEALLLALVRRGLDPGALKTAAALVLELDRQARERNQGEAAA
jgi:hypothetical protein